MFRPGCWGTDFVGLLSQLGLRLGCGLDAVLCLCTAVFVVCPVHVLLHG